MSRPVIRAIATYVGTLTGEMAPCPGEAHSNPNIDNCMTCAPQWGLVPVRAWSLEEAKRVGIARASYVPEEHHEAALAEGRKVSVEIIGTNRGGRGVTFGDVIVFDEAKFLHEALRSGRKSA